MRIVLRPIVFKLSIRSALQQTDGHRFDLIRTIGVLMWNLQTYKVRRDKTCHLSLRQAELNVWQMGKVK